ncbi:MAG: penicillin-binding protein 2, partial [Nonomuraea sp.]|nr:penicillin-binding protein 2 [Nonomuraea sp.]
MTKHIRYAGFFCVLLLAALLVNAARIQIVNARSYDDNHANRRSQIARYHQPRGDIVVGGEPVTGSRDSGEQLRYERTYRDGPLYAPVTGFASQVYGTTLLEHVKDSVLSGTDPALSAFPLVSGLTRARNRGGDIVTTLDPAAQRAAYAGLDGRKGAVAAIEPATGRVLALVSSPSYDPSALSGNAAATARSWA